MSTKSLLINSSNSKTEVKGKWHLFEEAQPFIQGIETGQIADEITAEALNSLISGVPSPWARARLFGFAFPYTQVEANIRTSGLIEFYEMLVNEWKGLIACIALFPNRITISEPIYLDKDHPALFHLPAALGRMLFEDADLWCDPAKLATNPDEKPFIQLIYYAGKLIGGTSPYSLVFTAAEYGGLPQTSDMPWYKGGYFHDPVQMKVLTNDQLQKLYLLVRNIIETNFLEFEQHINSNRQGKAPLDYNGLKEFLRKWKDEIRAAGTGIVDEGTLDASLNFAPPYHPLFQVKQSLYVYPNLRISFKGGEGAIEVDPQEILLQEDYILEFKQTDPRQPLEQAAVHYLQVPNPDYNPNQPELEPQKLYFPIPLSEKGLLIFKNRIGDLIAPHQPNEHELLGYIKPNEYKLVVELHLVIDGKKLTPISKEYELEPIENERHVIAWPNFISQNWTSYYLYSEFAETDPGTHLVPFFKAASDQSILTHNRSGKILYADSKDMGETPLRVEKLVAYPDLTLDSSFHKYDILKTNMPIAGLELRKHLNGEDRVLGYLIVKNPEDDSMGDRKIKDLTHSANHIEAVVGLDFGSNNSCLQFARTNGSEIQPVPFANRRMFLVGAEVIDPNKEKIALPHELYYFQNEPTDNGQIKSWLHEHNPNYIQPGMKDQEIAGGVPVFKPNIHIKDMDERTITTNAGTLHHSMKWLTEQKDLAKKKAYLKTVWLNACADLYASGYMPAELRWSYPGSFSNAERLQYEVLYRDIVATCPIEGARVELNEHPSTEAEAVSNYALTTGRSLDAKNVFLGIDVGGSTSDILVIAMDREARAFRLLKQSSVRLAAGYIMKAVSRAQAKGFRQALLHYHDHPRSPVRIPNIRTLEERPNTAPFFLNAIFDRLKGQSFEDFYTFLAGEYPRLFALPAYMTGLLLYYGGQLIAKTIGEHAFLSQVNQVDLFPFGKGGRIFDWLDAYPGKAHAQAFYNQCFQAGFGQGGEQIKLFKKDDIRSDNKSEVAIGLVGATEQQRVKTDDQLRLNSDIFGEKGFKIFAQGQQAQELRADDIISTRHFEDLQFGLEFPERFESFEKFLDIYLQFVGPATTGMLGNVRSLREQAQQLSRELKGFIMTDPEYRKAQDGSTDVFDYKHSMLVLEGMCYLEKMLIPGLFNV
ncbi:MAG: hypothetical protein D6730_09015 [Bacteroidetes bacterium]|nr:MAG: hypothetical protein D6730_09015 [Bacteroidota bacterium]